MIQAVGEVDISDHVFELGAEEAERAEDGSFEGTVTIDEAVDVGDDGDIDAAVVGIFHQEGQLSTVTEDEEGVTVTTDYGEVRAEGAYEVIWRDSGWSADHDQTTLVVSGGQMRGYIDLVARNSQAAGLSVDGLMFGQDFDAMAGTWSDPDGSGTVVIDGVAHLTGEGVAIGYDVGITVSFGSGTSVRVEGSGSVDFDDLFDAASIQFYVSVDGTVYGPIGNDELVNLKLTGG